MDGGNLQDTQKLIAAWEATPAHTGEDRLTRDARLTYYRDRALRLATAEANAATVARVETQGV